MGSSLSAREANAPSRMTVAGVTLSTAERCAQRQRVLGQGAGLVRAQHVDAGQFLDGDQPADDGLLLGEQPCADGHRHRQHGGHRDRDRGDGQHQGELQRGQDRVAAQDRRDDDKRHQRDREDDQVVADLEHGALEMADGVRVLHQFGGLAEVGAGAGGIHQGADLTLPDDRPGEHGVTGCAGRGQRLPGQRGLIDLDLVAVEQPGVGGHDVTQAQPDHITGHQLPRRRGDPCAVAFHARVDRELGFEGLNRVACLPFLGVADHTVGQQQQQDDEEIRPVPDRAGQDDGDLDHPRDRPPEVAEELQQRVGLVLGDLVRPVLRQPLRGLGLTQAAGE